MNDVIYEQPLIEGQTEVPTVLYTDRADNVQLYSRGGGGVSTSWDCQAETVQLCSWERGYFIQIKRDRLC